MDQKAVDFLIVGQGLAGTALALSVLSSGGSCVVLADNQIESASSKAVGLINPVTGRRLVKTWNFDEIFPVAFQFYEKAYCQIFPGSQASRPLFEPLPIFKALHSVEEINFISARSGWPEYGDLVSVISLNKGPESIFNSTLGWAQFGSGGRVDPKFFLPMAAEFFRKQGSLIVENFNPETLTRMGEFWIYNGIKARNVVSCLGLNCPWVGKELIAVKGQVLLLSGLPDFGRKVLKTDKFFIPDDPGFVLAGSTYEREFTQLATDQKGAEEILADLSPEIKAKLKIENSWSGLRPTTTDRRPIIRKLDDGLFALNGLGTKGVSIAPWAAGKILEMAGFYKIEV